MTRERAEPPVDALAPNGAADHPIDGQDEPAFQPWRLRAHPADGRRYELFALAAPIFREHGYRGATIKALAHACHISPAGLYHYFGSKRDFATFPLSAGRLDWRTTYVDDEVDPIVQLRQLVDLAIEALPTYMLALQLAEEIGGGPDAAERGATFAQGEAVFGRLLTAVDPGLGRDAAIEVARHVIALLAGSAFAGLDPPGAKPLRGRMVAALRQALVPGGVDPARFEEVMAARGATE